jgi:hypothetical protein
VAASTSLTPSQRSQRASIAALARWAQEDPTPGAQRGQAGLQAKFVRQAAEAAAAKGEVLTEQELARRGEVLYRLHMRRIRFNASRRAHAAGRS